MQRAVMARALSQYEEALAPLIEMAIIVSPTVRSIAAVAGATCALGCMELVNRSGSRVLSEDASRDTEAVAMGRLVVDVVGSAAALLMAANHGSAETAHRAVLRDWCYYNWMHDVDAEYVFPRMTIAAVDFILSDDFLGLPVAPFLVAVSQSKHLIPRDVYNRVVLGLYSVSPHALREVENPVQFEPTFMQTVRQAIRQQEGVRPSTEIHDRAVELVDFVRTPEDVGGAIRSQPDVAPALLERLSIAKVELTVDFIKGYYCAHVLRAWWQYKSRPLPRKRAGELLEALMFSGCQRVLELYLPHMSCLVEGSRDSGAFVARYSERQAQTFPSMNSDQFGDQYREGPGGELVTPLGWAAVRWQKPVDIYGFPLDAVVKAHGLDVTERVTALMAGKRTPPELLAVLCPIVRFLAARQCVDTQVRRWVHVDTSTKTVQLFTQGTADVQGSTLTLRMNLCQSPNPGLTFSCEGIRDVLCVHEIAV